MKKQLPQGVVAAFLVSLLVGGQGAWAVGQQGPSGPTGPQGTIGPERARAPSGNRIEVTGNTATGVRCPQGSSVSVNSVHVEGAELRGRTVIVQGRNATDAQSSDCVAPPGSTASVPAQVNSVNIR